jgi:putative flippase GtrA
MSGVLGAGEWGSQGGGQFFFARKTGGRQWRWRRRAAVAAAAVKAALRLRAPRGFMRGVSRFSGACPRPRRRRIGRMNTLPLLRRISSALPPWVRFSTAGAGDSTRIVCTVAASQAFVMFCAIGAVNTLIHFTLLTGLVRGTAWFYALNLEQQDFWQPWFNGAGFLAANVFSYFANSRWNFKAETGVGRYLKFVVTSLVGLLLAFSIMRYGVRFLNAHYGVRGWHYLLVFAGQTALMPFVNFTLLRLLVFRKRRHKGA